MKKLVIIMAPPGAGKNELANYICNQHNNSIIINKNNFSSDLDYYKSINEALENQEYVILDSQTALYQERAELFAFVNLKHKDIKIIGVWVETGRKEADYRNSQKTENKKPSNEKVDFYFKYKISPMPNEPFDDLVYIMRDADIGMSKSYPYLHSIQETLDRL